MTEAERATVAADGFARAAEAGIHRISVPTPFAVGRVNCYLIEDRPLTLVDTGPNSGKSLDVLEQALAERGHTVEDLELIVITHQHMDHLGLLEVLVRRSGAEVAALHLLSNFLQRFPERMAAEDEFSQEIMRRNGIPPDVVAVLGGVGAAFRAFGSRGRVTRPLHEGDVLELAERAFKVLHRPGHSPSDTIFYDAERRLLIAGDHLLAHISSNPLVSRPLESDADPHRRPAALIRYIESMQATRELPAELTLTGHGEPVRHHAALIDERLRLHSRRAEKILGILSSGPLSAYEIALSMWGNVAVTQAYLTLSEVLGHLDLLLRDGRAAEEQDGEVSRFRAL